MDDSLVVAIRLAKEGFMGGNPVAILRSPVDVVLAMLEFSGFLIDYQDAYREMNRPQK